MDDSLLEEETTQRDIEFVPRARRASSPDGDHRRLEMSRPAAQRTDDGDTTRRTSVTPSRRATE